MTLGEIILFLSVENVICSELIFHYLLHLVKIIVIHQQIIVLEMNLYRLQWYLHTDSYLKFSNIMIKDI